MGCINKIEQTFITVSLPGRLTGRVLVTAISDSYVNIVNKFVNDADNIQGYKNLLEMFTIGQIVCVKVIQIVNAIENARGYISLSLKPSDIQTDFVHNQIEKDAMLCVAIEGVEDHGYVLETGIKNLRGFLPATNAPIDLGVGEVIFCKVNQAKPSNAASTIIVKVADAKNRQMPKVENPNLAYILPSTVVKFKVTKILQDGIQGGILNETFTGYINEHQLEKSTSLPSSYSVDSVLQARILYVMPITKLVYLSLNLCDEFKHFPEAESKYKIGTIIEEARVTRIGTGGLILKLDSHHKGLISFKTLKIGYHSNFDNDELMAKFHNNSCHKVRITGYDPMDSLYICSNNEQVLDNKYFVLADVEIGDYVDAEIMHKLQDGGYFVRVGAIKGNLAVSIFYNQEYYNFYFIIFHFRLH